MYCVKSTEEVTYIVQSQNDHVHEGEWHDDWPVPNSAGAPCHVLAEAIGAMEYAQRQSPYSQFRIKRVMVIEDILRD